MPDITMCKGEGCELREFCYRFKAEPSKYRQSYFMNPPIDNDVCNHFWDMRSKNR